MTQKKTTCTKAQGAEVSAKEEKYMNELLNALWLKFVGDMFSRSAFNNLSMVHSKIYNSFEKRSIERMLDMAWDIMCNDREKIPYYLERECLYSADDLDGWLKSVEDRYGGRLFDDGEVELMVSDYNKIVEQQKEIA